MSNAANLETLYGVKYLEPGTSAVVESPETDAYSYVTYLGKHSVNVEKGDSAWIIEDDGKRARVAKGPTVVESAVWTTVIRGYRTEDKTVELNTNTVLPYVNGCSTKQVFPPDRSGDPTLQLLKIPPFSSEQAHHIHSTVRVVYVLDGWGYSIVGMNGHVVKKKLVPGMLVVLDKMCPHHFETEDSWLTVVPLHVFSALPKGIENDHPMFNGTFLMNQGG